MWYKGLFPSARVKTRGQAESTTKCVGRARSLPGCALNCPCGSVLNFLFRQVCLVSYCIFMFGFMNISNRKLILNLFLFCLFFQEMYVCKLPLIYVNTEAEEFHFIVTN